MQNLNIQNPWNSIEPFTLEDEPMTEAQARTELTCPNCGEYKDHGLVVCWTCFKYIPNNYKNSGLSFEDWIAEQKGE